MKKMDPADILKRYWPVFVLLVIFVTALWFRSFPARFSEIQALDPFFFYRMGLEVMENDWELGMDMMRYYPGGVDTIQSHYLVPIYLPAVAYSLLVGMGMNMHYLHFAIMWPAWLGALAVIPMYFLGKELFNSRKAGVFSAFFLASVPAFITRTSAGFFEKEPIAGVFIISSVYFFVRAFKRGSWTSGIFAGASLAMVSLVWGGVQYIYMLYAGFMITIFIANAVVVLLDYLFSGFGGFIETLERYVSLDMIKAYLPLMLIGTLAQQPLARKTSFDNISIIVSIGVLAILLIRYGADRFKLVKKEQMPYVVPAIIVLTLCGSMVGAMFSDYLTSSMAKVTEIVTFSKSVIGSTVAENAPGGWDDIASTTGTTFSNSVLPQLGGIAPYLSPWIFMFLCSGILLYSLYRTRDWMVLFPIVWLLSAIMGVFYYVRLVFLIGPPAALLAGFFMTWVVDRFMRMGFMEKVKDVRNLLDRKNRTPLIASAVVAIFVAVVVVVNFASAYTYSLNLGPSICFPRYNSNNPFDVVPCVTIVDGEEVLSSNQPWYEAFNYMANETPENSSILSWWDFGYWFQTRGKRPSTADGGHTEGQYPGTDHTIASWYVDDTDNWGNYTEWLEEREVGYILMDYTLPGKYGAISKIASDGAQIVGFLQFTQNAIEPSGNDTIYIFSHGPVYDNNLGTYVLYEIWLPLNKEGGLTGTPMFLIKRQDNGQYYQKSYINDVCANSGIVKAGSETPSIPGCVSISDLGVYYIPADAEHSIFVNLMFMNGTGLPVEKVFDNQLVKIYDAKLDD